MMRFRKFMYGRSGSDIVNIFILGVIIILGIISLFVSGWVLTVLQFIFLALFLFRFFSKNLSSRRRENDFLLKLVKPLRSFFRGLKNKLTDKNNKYYRCPKCGAKLRVPRNRGNITITCPVCKNKFVKKT